MKEFYIVNLPFIDGLGVVVIDLTKFYIIRDKSSIWHKAHDVYSSVVYRVCDEDLDLFCTKVGEEEETECKSYVPESEISPVIKKWMSTLPKKLKED